MNDTADPSSRRYRRNPRVLFFFAIFALSVSLVPAYAGPAAVAAIGESEANTHVEATEALPGRKGEHKARLGTAVQRMQRHRRLLATKRIKARATWRRRQSGPLPPNPCHAEAPTRAPPTVR